MAEDRDVEAPSTRISKIGDLCGRVDGSIWFEVSWLKTRERWAESRVSNARDKYMLHHACAVATQLAWEAKALVPLAVYFGFGCVVQTPLGGTGTSGNIMALRMAFAVTSDHEWLATAIRPQNWPG